MIEDLCDSLRPNAAVNPRVARCEAQPLITILRWRRFERMMRFTDLRRINPLSDQPGEAMPAPGRGSNRSSAPRFAIEGVAGFDDRDVADGPQPLPFCVHGVIAGRRGRGQDEVAGR